jgi:hypothetical protein
MRPSGIEPLAFRLVVQYLRQLSYRAPYLFFVFIILIVAVANAPENVALNDVNTLNYPFLLPVAMQPTGHLPLKVQGDQKGSVLLMIIVKKKALKNILNGFQSLTVIT